VNPTGRIVIAGGSGFLGSNLASYLASVGCDVVVLSRLALYGRYCVSRRLRQEGFEFRFPDISSALRNLYSPS
jgi:NAD dependent epimerase/dehydratase family enzyme